MRARTTPGAIGKAILGTADRLKLIRSYLVQFALEDVELLIGEGNLIHKVHLGGQHSAINTGL